MTCFLVKMSGRKASDGNANASFQRGNIVKAFKYFLVALMLMAVGVTYAHANIARLVLIDNSDFQKVNSDVYLSGELSSHAEEKVETLISDARKRIATHYGEINAEPKIVVLSSKQELKEYGLNDRPGALIFAPWGTYLLLNFETAGIDVAAHELVHAEVVQRVGYLKRYFDIPTWFDEGVAMQVDYRGMYDSLTVISAAEFIELTRLNKPKNFWSLDKHQNIQNYRTAKSAVSEMFKHTDEDLFSILDEVRNGNSDVIVSIANKTNKALQRTSR